MECCSGTSFIRLSPTTWSPFLLPAGDAFVRVAIKKAGTDSRGAAAAARRKKELTPAVWRPKEVGARSRRP